MNKKTKEKAGELVEEIWVEGYKDGFAAALDVLDRGYMWAHRQPDTTRQKEWRLWVRNTLKALLAHDLYLSPDNMPDWIDDED